MKRNLLFIFILLLLLTGCEKAKPETYSVRFWKGSVLLEARSVLPFAVPAAPDMPTERYRRFAGWDRQLEAATRDTNYRAIYVPVLMNHVPYLFPDENGMLCPDEPFTGEDLKLALDALGEYGAKKYYPVIRVGSMMTAGQLRDIMLRFFPEQKDFLNAGDMNRKLTRSEAAGILNTLLGREESVEPLEWSRGFADVPQQRADYAVLMEAAALHRSGNKTWDSIRLATNHPSGLCLTAGRLSFYDDYGYPSTESDEWFMLDENGYYTCGNAELDELVTGILAQLQKENPGADRETLLHAAFEYTRDSFRYLRKKARSDGETDWEIEDALTMLTTGKGNCYNYAATFWALARGLGFEAVAHAGEVASAAGGLTPHGWVTIEFDGEEFLFDTELEMAFRQQGTTWVNLYKMSASRYSLYNYTKPQIRAWQAMWVRAENLTLPELPTPWELPEIPSSDETNSELLDRMHANGIWWVYVPRALENLQ